MLKDRCVKKRQGWERYEPMGCPSIFPRAEKEGKKNFSASVSINVLGRQGFLPSFLFVSDINEIIKFFMLQTYEETEGLRGPRRQTAGLPSNVRGDRPD